MNDVIINSLQVNKNYIPSPVTYVLCVGLIFSRTAKSVITFGLVTVFRFTGLFGTEGIELSASINPAEIATKSLFLQY